MNASCARLDNFFSEYDRPDGPGASVMLIDHGEIAFSAGYGLANLEEKIACAIDTNFRLASLTKQLTAMAILLLVQQSKVSLEARLTDFFPELTGSSRGIILRQLLNHTSGLLDYEDQIPAGTATPLVDRDVLNLLCQQTTTYFPPGTQFRYSNSGYALLALVVQACSGESFARFLKQQIFAPLKMSGTVAYEAGISVVSNRAYGYSGAGQGWVRTDQSLTSAVLGDGGIYSSVADLYRWDQALYTAELVEPALLELAFTSSTAADRPDTGYGFGWYIGQYRGLKEIWHYGNTIGFTTRIARFPEKQFTIIILANRNEAPLGELLRRVEEACLLG
ncbi:Beta-lactamase [Verrucomicrobia bacterium]|nr:Beta-lactamase [Verrucomicrobiota bacterium]